MSSVRRHHPWTPYLYLLPAGLVLGTFMLVAMGQIFYYSVTKYTVFQGPDFIGLENYRRALTDPTFRICFINSWIYLLITPVLIVISLLCAQLVNSGLRGSSVFRVLLFFPVITPTIVASIAWRVLLNEDTGLLNEAIAALGGPRVPWLTERPWTLFSPMLVTLWKGFGYYMMIFLAGLMAVPRELEEAAEMDGAGAVRVFWNVTLPCLRPTLILVATISSISALKVFDELFVTVRGAPVSHKTLVPLIFEEGFGRGQFGYASAVSVLLFLAVLAFSLVHLRLSGAVK
jgi:putative chitobiose transport system permease protein